MANTNLLLLKTDSPKKLHSLCRMCATYCEKSISIFGPDGVANELANKIANHLPIKVSESDNLPLHICYECTNILIQWDAAVLGSVAAEKKLRALQWQELQSQLDQNDLERGPLASEQTKSATSISGESLCCSVCNKSKMDFRQLISHLKTHDSSGVNQQQENGNLSVHFSKESRVKFVDSEASLNGSYDTLQDSRGDLSNSFTSQPMDSPPSSAKMQLRSKRKVCELETSSPEASLKTLGSDTRGKGRKKRSKWSTNSSSGKGSPSSVERGSGDPVVTSSTNTPVSRPPEGKDHSALPEISSPIDSSSNSTAEEDKQNFSTSSQVQAVTFKPKVRIISAENINHTLEQRAMANQSSKNLDFPQTSADLVDKHFSRSLIPILPKPKTVDPASLPQKARIIVSSSVMKDLKLDKLQSGCRYLKLSDGRIIRLLGSSGGVSQKMPLKASSVLRSTPTGPVLTQVRLGPSPVKHVVLSSSVPSQLDPQKGHSQGVPGISREKSGSLQSPSTSPSESRGPFIQSVESRRSVDPSDASFCGPAVLTFSNKATECSEKKNTPSIVHISSGENNLIAFELQPGPKHGVHRYKCSYCEKRNLDYDILYEHAQSHRLKVEVPDKE